MEMEEKKIDWYPTYLEPCIRRLNIYTNEKMKTQQTHNVVRTSPRRHDVAASSERRYVFVDKQLISLRNANISCYY